MKILYTIAVLLMAFTSFSQTGSQVYAASASGSIIVPSLQSINVELLQSETILFNKAEEFDLGKTFPNFVKVTVISNTPYLVSVMANGEHFTSTNIDAPLMPVSVISLQENMANQFLNMSAAAKPLLISKSTQMKATYMVDARFNPGWNYSGGQYNTTLTFTLSAQ